MEEGSCDKGFVHAQDGSKVMEEENCHRGFVHALDRKQGRWRKGSVLWFCSPWKQHTIGVGQGVQAETDNTAATEGSLGSTLDVVLRSQSILGEPISK